MLPTASHRYFPVRRVFVSSRIHLPSNLCVLSVLRFSSFAGYSVMLRTRVPGYRLSGIFCALPPCRLYARDFLRHNLDYPPDVDRSDVAVHRCVYWRCLSVATGPISSIDIHPVSHPDSGDDCSVLLTLRMCSPERLRLESRTCRSRTMASASRMVSCPHPVFGPVMLLTRCVLLHFPPSPLLRCNATTLQNRSMHLL